MSDDLVKRLRDPMLDVAFFLRHEAADEIERLRAALRFYAEPHGDGVQIPDFYSELDFGETARAALAKGETK